MNPYTLTTVAKPPHGTVCIAWIHARPHLAIFHKAIGDFKSGGDFALITYTKLGSKLTHLPGVTRWMEVPV